MIDAGRTSTLADRAEQAGRGGRLRILVAGAGIAGATLAALLRRRGQPVAVLERGGPDDDPGYMLGLMPLGARVLNGLDLTERYEEVSIPMRTYTLYDRHGQPEKSYPLGELVERYGSYRGVERGALLSLLRGEVGPVLYGASIEALDEQPDHVDVTLSDGSRSRFDLVVVAEGIHAPTRAMILADDEVERFDTGWGGYVLWSDAEGLARDTYAEMWAAGWGLGLYPVKGRVGIFLGGRHRGIVDLDPHQYAALVADRLPEGVFTAALAQIDPDEPAFYWRMADCRAQRWHTARTVLLGDAAAAFLPTAGVGASVAMDSAAALADELARADQEHMDFALTLHGRRQRHRVEKAQKNSRDLARYMFIDSAFGALIRDQLMRFYTLEHMLSDLSEVVEGA